MPCRRSTHSNGLPAPSSRSTLKPLALAVHLAMFGVLAAAAAWMPGAAAQTPQAGDTRRYDIPAGPLSATLTRFSIVSGTFIVGATNEARAKTSPGVQGTYTVSGALRALLAGTGLEAVAQEDGSYSLRQAPVVEPEVSALPAVAVIGSAPAEDLPPAYAGGQVARGGRLGMLGNTDVMDTPFNQTSYTSALIADQQAHTVGDVLDNDSSVRRAGPASGLYEPFQIRGFVVNSSDIAFNGLYGVVPRNGSVPLDFAERVEILKGPSALLSGMAPNGVVGGAINVVPKRASDDPLTRLTVGMDSDSLWHTNVDVGRRFGQDNEWGVRVNGGYTNGDTYVDGQSKRGSNTGSIALDYRGKRARMALDAYRLEDRNRGGGAMSVAFADGLAALPHAPSGRSNFTPWVEGNTRTEGVVLSGEFDITSRLTAFAKAGYTHYEYSGYMLSQLANLQTNGDASALVMRIPYDNHGDSEEAGLRGTFDTGPVRHTLVLSGARQMDYENYNFAYNSFNTNIYSPGMPDSTLLPGAGAAQPFKQSTRTLGSVAMADTLSMLDDRVLLTLGIRKQNVETENYDQAGATTARYDKGAWTPMLGVVVKPRQNLSLYGNVIQGLSAGTIVAAGYQNAGEIFPPYKTKQIEVGAKLETGNITNTLSFFQINKPNTLTDFSTSPLPTMRPNGEQRNRGIEWNVFGQVTTGVRVLGGVTYIQGRLTKTQDGAYDGNKAPGAAPWATNLGVEWDVPGVAGLTLSGRVINTSSQYADNANKLKLPNWTRVDIGARYATRVDGHPTVFRANIHNLFDRNYWEGVYASGVAGLGAPRTFMLSATMDF